MTGSGHNRTGAHPHPGPLSSEARESLTVSIYEYDVDQRSEGLYVHLAGRQPPDQPHHKADHQADQCEQDDESGRGRALPDQDDAEDEATYETGKYSSRASVHLVKTGWSRSPW